MEKVTSIDEGEFKKPCYIDDMGTYNTMPRPYREISWHEFFHRWAYCMQFVEHRQITEEEFGFMSLHIMYFHKEALAVSSPSDWHLGKDRFGRDGLLWDEKPRFFRIGCEHDFEPFGAQYMHLHTSKCKKCGYTETVDSLG